MKQYLARAQQFWLERNTRERTMLSACAALILFAILYTGLWQPLVTQRAALNKRVPQLQAQLAQMQHDLQLLKGRVTVARSDDLRQAVSASLQQHGLKADLQALPDSRIRIDDPEADFSHVLDFLGELQRETGAHVVNFDASGIQNNGVVHFSAVVQR
jgi:general secretion pathway protein M